MANALGRKNIAASEDELTSISSNYIIYIEIQVCVYIYIQCKLYIYIYNVSDNVSKTIKNMRPSILWQAKKWQC